MSVSAIVKTVLIVDEDLGFVFWLGCLLAEAGYQVWPARNGSDAAALLKELEAKLDLLVINPSAGGAAEFIEDQRRRSDFKTVAVQGSQDESPMLLTGVDVTLTKPQSRDELSELEWVGVIDSILVRRQQ